MSTTTTVTTASGRLYEFDFTSRKYRRSGDAEDFDFTTGGRIEGRDAWSDFSYVQVSDLGRLMIVEPSGYYLHSTRVVDGLDDLLAVLDGGA